MGGHIRDRTRLTGSWFGLRDEMGKKGVVLDIDILQVPQGVASGGLDTVAEYGGLAEYTLNMDTQKLSLWPGGFFTVQAMSSFGQNVDSGSGALIPPDMVLLLPDFGNETTGLMSLSFTQFLSPKFGLFAGKLSALGADTNEFAHDYHSQFLNAGLNLNMTLALFPFTGYGGGLIILPWEGAVFSASVMDPSGRRQTTTSAMHLRMGYSLLLRVGLPSNPSA